MLIQSERCWRLFDFLAFTCGEKLMANATGPLCRSASAPRRHTSPPHLAYFPTNRENGTGARTDNSEKHDLSDPPLLPPDSRDDSGG